MKNESDFLTAPCLLEGDIGERAEALVDAARILGTGRWASTLRSWCVPYLFNSMEQTFASACNPVEGLNQALESLSHFLSGAANSDLAKLNSEEKTPGERKGEVITITGEHYGRLFQAFSSRSFWDEPVRLLRTRLERNGVDISGLEQKEVLDVGCGGGRYTAAWRILGAKRAVGIDGSEIGIADAVRRTDDANLEGVEFKQGNALSLPFEDQSFDIVFSNGVLHHTENWQQGVNELVRVLKRGGLGWLYLIENPGGLFWDVIELLRLVMKDEPRDLARAALELIGIPSNRIFYMLDHVMVPINIRLRPEQVEDCLAKAGATGIRRLNRGTDFDRIEKIYRGESYATVKYGVGENRYVFSKA
jgi:SAM-dependent methyltransferase